MYEKDRLQDFTLSYLEERLGWKSDLHQEWVLVNLVWVVVRRLYKDDRDVLEDVDEEMILLGIESFQHQKVLGGSTFS